MGKISTRQGRVAFGRRLTRAATRTMACCAALTTLALGACGQDEAPDMGIHDLPSTQTSEPEFLAQNRYGIRGAEAEEAAEVIPSDSRDLQPQRESPGATTMGGEGAMGRAAPSPPALGWSGPRGTIGHGSGGGRPEAGHGRAAGLEALLDQALVGPSNPGRRTGRAGPAAARSRPLPRNGVLASNFVAGSGVQARLSDLLDRGVMVDGHHVRLQAFEDRQRLPYPLPRDQAVAMHADLERTRVDASGDTVHMQVALMARQGEAPVRPRMDVRLVLDASGSMRDKWRSAIAAAHALVRKLDARDTLGIIRYSDEAELVLAETRVGDGGRAHRVVDSLEVGGGTNIEGALRLAAAHMPQRQSPTDVGLVVLVSDGQATIGRTDAGSLGDLARQMFDDGGVLTTTIGLGTDFDEETMLSVAREGSGTYHFVRRPADITAILEDELDDRVQAVAQALRLRVVLGPGVVARRIYGSRLLNEQEHAAVRATEVATDRRIAEELGVVADRATEVDEGLRIHLPTFRRGDQHVVLMELEVPPGRAGSTAGVARVHLDYKDLVRQQNGEARQLVAAERVDDRSEAMASLRRPVKRTVLSFQAGEALQLAASALTSGNPQSATALLTERRELLEAAAELWRDPHLRRDAALLGRYQRVVARAYGGFNHGDQRTLAMAMRYFGDQRMR